MKFLKSDPIKRSSEILDEIRNIDASNPVGLEVDLDRLASALISISQFKGFFKDDDERLSLRGVLGTLESKGKMESSAEGSLSEIETILEKIDYDSFDEDDEGPLSDAIGELCDAIEKSLSKLNSK